MRSNIEALRIANKIKDMYLNGDIKKAFNYAKRLKHVRVRRLKSFLNVRNSEIIEKNISAIIVRFNSLGDTYRIDIMYK